MSAANGVISDPTDSLLYEEVRATTNLFDARRVETNRFLSQAGTPNDASGTGFFVSDFIPVTPGLTYWGNNAQGQGMRFTTFYAADKVTVVAGGSGVTVTSTVIPPGVAYIRFTGLMTAGVPIDYAFYAAGAPVAPTDGKWATTYPVDTFKEVSLNRNLFQAETALDGYYINSVGLYAALSTLTTGGFIKVTPGDIYTFYGGRQPGANRVAYYGPNQNFLQLSPGSVTTLTVPAGVYWIRPTFDITLGQDKWSAQVQWGGKATTWEPYGLRLPRTPGRAPSPVWGMENLKSWSAQRIAPTARAYDIVFHGDSYTDGGYYTLPLYNLFFGSLPYGGPGFCSAFAADDGSLPSNSIVPAKWSVTRGAVGQWISAFSGTPGLNGTATVSQLANSTLAFVSTETLATVDIIYKRSSGGPTFNYNLNGGANTPVSTANATTDVFRTVVNTSGAGAGFTLNIIAPAGVTIYGAIGRKGGNTITLHKAGLTGSQASNFGADPLFQTSASYTNPKLVTFMWGVNDLNANILPSVMRVNVQRLVNYYLAINPQCDFIFSAPNQQTYGSSENPRAYTAADYADAMYRLAVVNRGAFIDFDRIFGTFNQSQVDAGYIASDRVHPGTVGSSTMAATFAGMFGL